MDNIYNVILAGGRGTRLWPLSRNSMPKQFIKLFGKHSLFQKNILRHLAFIPNAPIIIGNNEHRFIIAEQLREIAVNDAIIVLEPESKNTAPAAIIAALFLNKYANAHMLITPSDHIIQDEAAYQKAILTAYETAKQGYFLTFGIMPNHPATGFGYIQKSTELNSGAFQVESFHEKPDIKKATQFLLSGDYLWNAGIFLFNCNSFLEQMAGLDRAMFDLCKLSFEHIHQDLSFHLLDKSYFSQIKEDSIDYGFLEKQNNIATVPCNMGWSDLGSWQALWEIEDKDENQNVTVASCELIDTHNCYINSSSDKIVATIGIDNLVIVDSDDALLIATKDRCQEVKAIVKALEKRGEDAATHSSKEYRPWGYYSVIDSGKNFKVKNIAVHPGGVLSLQVHQNRSEHWVIVSGLAKVQKGQDIIELSSSQSIHIEKGQIHRLENIGSTDLHLIEVQCGEVLSEDDITRLEDVYGRVVEKKAVSV